MAIYRAPWPDDFPDVVVHTTEDIRNRDPDYSLAKRGNKLAALRLVDNLLNDQAVENINSLISDSDTLIAAVTAIEKEGYNAIPDAMAVMLSNFNSFTNMVLPIRHTSIRAKNESGQIRQINQVSHTKAKPFWRFVTPAEFGGIVETGRNYILVDDHIGHGGTLANLRGYIEHSGGHVIGMTTLTASRDAQQIRLENDTLNMLRSKHGQELEQLWQDTFGYGLDCLTQVEGRYLARQQDVDTIRRFMAKAAKEVHDAGLFPIQEIDTAADT